MNIDAFDKMLLDPNVQNRTVYFADGEYIFSDTMVLTSDISLCGGANTVLRLDEQSDSDVLLSLNGIDNVTLSHLKILGSHQARPSEQGARTGIRIEASRAVNIENVDVAGWGLYGIYAKTMSSYGNAQEGKFYKQLQILNSRFFNNYYGTYLDYRCEYTQMLNCVFGENYIGSVNCGGNNMYVSCMWNSNHYGFIMENQGSNPAHGGCNACTFNHNDHAIVITDCVNGWTFDGCQIFYSTVKLTNSVGVIFSSNIWGSCSLISTGTRKHANMITSCYFLTDSAKILQGNDGSTYVTNCLPDHLDPPNSKDLCIASSVPDTTATKRPLSTNAYAGACGAVVPAGVRIDYADFEVVGAGTDSVVRDVNVWVVRADTGEVVEQLVENESPQVQYSGKLYAYVVRFELSKQYEYPVWLAVQCQRVNGVSIAYYQAERADAGWLQGDVAPVVGDLLSANSNVVPIYAIYQKGE